jgi:hypothetical protein
MAVVVKCQWCDAKFASHAELSIHQMYRDGNPRCPKYPKITEDWGY